MKATKEQIAAWKNAYGEVYQIIVFENKPLPLPEELLKEGHKQPTATDEIIPRTGYFKAPSLEVIAAVQRHIQSDPVRAQSEAFTGCWIDGDARLVNDPALMLSAAMKIMPLIKMYDGEIKKL